ncbi:MAG TPA: hypothetical protein VK631_24500 [Solirubrobacteraceae bacterium]|nr:hypothetical protein [Solirubrobacteraceae bacterium]
MAWGVHVGALALAPLSIVQAVPSGALVLLAVFAERCFGFELGRRQWVGVTIAAPSTRLAVDRTPSLAPSTATRSQLISR